MHPTWTQRNNYDGGFTILAGHYTCRSLRSYAFPMAYACSEDYTNFHHQHGLHYINHSTSTLFFFKSFFYFYIFALSESLPSISMAASVDPLVVGRVIGDVVDMFIPKVTMSVYFGPKHVTNGCDIKPSTAINPPKITITGHADELYTLVCFLHHACVFFLWKLRLSMCYIWFISKQARLTCICICRF